MNTTQWRSTRARRGVTLLEVLCASLASIAVLGSLGGLYLIAFTAHGTGTLVAESLIYEGRAEERLRTIQLIAATRGAGAARSRFRIIQGPVIAQGANLVPDNRPSFISIAYHANINHRDDTYRAALTPPAGNPNAAIFPRADRANDFLTDPARPNQQSGIFFWWRANGDAESNLYFIQIPRMGNAAFDFAGMDGPAVATFISNPLNRNACELVSQNIVNFEVTPPGPGAYPVNGPGDVTEMDISWRIEYRARDF